MWRQLFSAGVELLYVFTFLSFKNILRKQMAASCGEGWACVHFHTNYTLCYIAILSDLICLYKCNKLHLLKTQRTWNDSYFIYTLQTFNCFFPFSPTISNYNLSVYLMCFHLATHKPYHPTCDLIQGLAYTIHNGNQFSRITKQYLPYM